MCYGETTINLIFVVLLLARLGHHQGKKCKIQNITYLHFTKKTVYTNLLLLNDP
jgi:hypothetical protein